VTDRIIKVYGERNTGTRAMIQLLKQVPGTRFRLGPKPEPTADETEVIMRCAMTLRCGWPTATRGNTHVQF